MTALPIDVVTAQHMRALHPVEQLLVALVAFGPFVVLAFVVRHQRRDSHDG